MNWHISLKLDQFLIQEANHDPATMRVWITLIFAVMSIGTLLVLVNQAYAQDDVVSQLKMELSQRGVPVKSVAIKNRVPFELDIEIQSRSVGQKAQPEDALFENAVHRQVALTRARGREDRFNQSNFCE